LIYTQYASIVRKLWRFQLKRASLILALIVGLFFCSESLYALGIGFYGDFNSGLTVGKYLNSHWAPGGGLIIDSNVSQDKIFNYRLELGYDWFNVSWFPGSSADYYFDSCSKLSSNHYFGIGIIRTKDIRFWVGPNIEISGLFGQGHNGIFGGLGFAMGTNFHISDTFSFSMVISLRAVGGMIYGSYLKTSSSSGLTGLLASFGLSQSSGNVETINENLGFYGGSGRISLACIFRINDTYAAPAPAAHTTTIKLTAPAPPSALVAPAKQAAPAVPAFPVAPVKK
jgi:hypothetical protein